MAGSQSLERGLDVLELLDNAPAPLGVREIARRLSISATIVQRLVNTLAGYGYIMQDSETKRYAIGYRAFGLGWTLMQKDRLVAEAHLELERLASRHLLNGYVGALHGHRAIYLLSIQSAGPIAIRGTPGSLAYLHSTAMGKVLLACLPAEQARVLLAVEPLARLTPHTITDADDILAQLPGIARRGYAIVRGENLTGVVSVGVPIRDASAKVVAALSAAFAEGVSPGLTAESVVEIVTESAERVSRALGCSPPAVSRSGAGQG